MASNADSLCPLLRTFRMLVFMSLLDLLPGAGCYSHGHWRLASVPHPWQAASPAYHTGNAIQVPCTQRYLETLWKPWYRKHDHSNRPIMDDSWMILIMEHHGLLLTVAQFPGKVTTWIRIQGRTWSLQHLSSQIHVGRCLTGCWFLCTWMFPPGLQNVVQCTDTRYISYLHIIPTYPRP